MFNNRCNLIALFPYPGFASFFSPFNSNSRVPSSGHCCKMKRWMKTDVQLPAGTEKALQEAL